MLTKRLWGWAGLWFGAGFALFNIEKVADASPQSGAQAIVYLLVWGGWLALALIPFFKGNKWREASSQSRGYEVILTTKQ